MDCLGIHHILRESVSQIDHSDRKESLPSQPSGSWFENLHCVPSGTSRLLISKNLLASTFSSPFNILKVSIRSLLCLRSNKHITSVVSGVLVSVHTCVNDACVTTLLIIIPINRIVTAMISVKMFAESCSTMSETLDSILKGDIKRND